MDIENKTGFDGDEGSPSVVSAESHLDVREKDKVQRRLHQRHVQMCAVPTISLHSHSDIRNLKDGCKDYSSGTMTANAMPFRR